MIIIYNIYREVYVLWRISQIKKVGIQVTPKSYQTTWSLHIVREGVTRSWTNNRKRSGPDICFDYGSEKEN